MMNQSQVNQLCEDNELAFFRADVCLSSPQSFTLEEKAKICEDMDATNKAIEDAIRADFEALPPEFQDKLFFGTDICQPTMPTLRGLAIFLKDLLAKGAISQTVFNKVARENAIRVLDL